LVAEYRESQMSVKAFSQIKGINPWSLKYWIKTKSKPKIPRNKAKWVEVIVEQKKTEDLQIHIGRHCQVQIREVGQIELAAALIQRMEQGV